MTYQEFIEELERKNPKLFAAERITITMESFRAQLYRAYAAGHDHQQEKPSVRGDAEAIKSLFGIFRN